MPFNWGLTKQAPPGTVSQEGLWLFYKTVPDWYVPSAARRDQHTVYPSLCCSPFQKRIKFSTRHFLPSHSFKESLTMLCSWVAGGCKDSSQTCLCRHIWQKSQGQGFGGSRTPLKDLAKNPDLKFPQRFGPPFYHLWDLKYCKKNIFKSMSLLFCNNLLL